MELFSSFRQRDGKSDSIVSVVLLVRPHYLTLRLSGWNCNQRPLSGGVSCNGRYLLAWCDHFVRNLQQGSPSDWHCKLTAPSAWCHVIWLIIWHMLLKRPLFSREVNVSKQDSAHWTNMIKQESGPVTVNTKLLNYKKLKLSHYTPRRRLGERRYSSYLFLTSAVDRSQRSASLPCRALAPGKGPPSPTGQKAGWAPEPVRTQRLEEKSFRLCRGPNLDRPVVQPAPRRYTYWATLLTKLLNREPKTASYSDFEY
jgi:hypothetical protein